MSKKICNCPQLYSCFQISSSRNSAYFLFPVKCHSQFHVCPISVFFCTHGKRHPSIFWIPLYREDVEKKKKKSYMSLQCLQHCGFDLALPVLFPFALPHSPSFLQLSPASLSFFIIFKGNSRWSVQCAKAQSFQKRLSRAFKILIQIHCNVFGFHLSPSTFPSMMTKQSQIPSLQERILEI